MSFTEQDVINLMKTHPNTRTTLIEYEASLLGRYQEYDAFVDRLLNDIEWVVAKLEDKRPYYQKASEDLISSHIVDLLEAKGYTVAHGQYSSGSTDIIVRHGPHRWIGEAKWHTSDEKVREAMRQLSTRYSTGSDVCSCGGLFIYNRRGKVHEKLQRLKKYWENDCTEYENLKTEECKTSQFAFYTTHIHADSGTEYRVRHRWINLSHNPQDASAKSRKK